MDGPSVDDDDIPFIFEDRDEEFLDSLPVYEIAGDPSPAALRAAIDEKVVGQIAAKEVLTQLFAMHLWNFGRDDAKPVPNALLMGPSGTGKTFTMATMAARFQLPMVTFDATSLVDTGIVGPQIEHVMAALWDRAAEILNSGGYRALPDDVRRLAERGVVFLDEFDKMRDESESGDSMRSRVQRRLLKLVEGDLVRVGIPDRQRHRMDRYLDTKRMLIIAGGAFVDIDRVRSRRTNDELYKQTFGESAIVSEDVQHYGFLPELVNRFAVIIEFEPLTQVDLVEILRSSDDSPLSIWREYAVDNGLEFEIETDALEVLANRASKLNSGARGLHQLIFPLLSRRFADANRDERTSIRIIFEDLAFRSSLHRRAKPPQTSGGSNE